MENKIIKQEHYMLESEPLNEIETNRLNEDTLLHKIENLNDSALNNIFFRNLTTN